MRIYQGGAFSVDDDKPERQIAPQNAAEVDGSSTLEVKIDRQRCRARKVFTISRI
jgi:hypothetical protein